MFTKWQYRLEPFGGGLDEIVDHLNTLGEEGWELVSVLSHETPLPYTQPPEAAPAAVYALILKRQAV